MFTSGIQILFNVFQVTNKVKQNSIAMIITGILSLFITVIIIKFTDYGIYAVAGVSSLCNLIRNMTFTIIVTAKYLGFKWNCFYKQVGVTIFSSCVLIIVGSLIKSRVIINSWMSLMFAAFIIGIVGLVINISILLNKQERKNLFELFFHKLGIKTVKE